MKKYNLIKIILISILFVFLLTIFMPISSITYNENYQLVIQKGNVSSAGLFGLFNNGELALQAFSYVALFVISIGCFYSVITKIETYNNFVEKVSNKFLGKEKLISIISIIVFAVLAIFVSEPLVLLIFVPFASSIMKKLNIDSKSILASTIVAILVGGMCNIYNQSLFSVLSLKINSLIIPKIILLVLSIVILVLFTAPKNSKVKKTNKKEEKKIEKKEVKKTSTKVSPKKTNSKGKKVTK